MNTTAIIVLIAGLVIGMGAGFLGRIIYIKKVNKEAENKAGIIVEEAQNQKMKMILDGKDEALKTLEKAKQEERDKRNKLQQIEDRLNKKEVQIDKRIDDIEKHKESLENKAQEVKQMVRKLLDSGLREYVQ